MGKLKSAIFGITGLILIFALFAWYSDSFAAHVASSTINEFLSNPLKHKWSGAFMLGGAFAMSIFFIFNRRTQAPYALMWLAAIGLLVFGVFITEAGNNAIIEIHDLFWNMVNNGQWRPFVGIWGIPVVMVLVLIGMSFYVSTGKAVVGAVVRETPSLTRHNSRKRPRPVKLKKRRK